MFAVPKQPAPVPLTDAEIEQLASKHLDVGDGERGTHYVFGEIDFARAILAAAQPAPVEPDWKAEYLKSVESGCITLDELRKALAELDATNRQVEILSDALAESRRQVAALQELNK
jgi:hypothetical protein